MCIRDRFDTLKLLSSQLSKTDICREFIVSLGYLYRADRGGWRFSVKKLDVGQEIRTTVTRFRSTLFMSATLSPLEYYIRLYGFSPEEVRSMRFESPFPKENKAVFIDVDLDFGYRSRTPEVYRKAVDKIRSIISVKPGNYIVFTPSYEMAAVFYEGLKDAPEISMLQYKVVMEHQNLSKDEKDNIISDLIHRAKEKRPTLLIAVMGGSFSEGIDLKGDSLIGVIIVSLGLPSRSKEQDRLIKYYDSIYSDGFVYAVIYPAVARVVQSAGRLIRSENDRGIIYLMDRRYTMRRWNFAFPEEFRECRRLIRGNPSHAVKDFWNMKRG